MCSSDPFVLALVRWYSAGHGALVCALPVARREHAGGSPACTVFWWSSKAAASSVYDRAAAGRPVPIQTLERASQHEQHCVGGPCRSFRSGMPTPPSKV